MISGMKHHVNPQRLSCLNRNFIGSSTIYTAWTIISLVEITILPVETIILWWLRHHFAWLNYLFWFNLQWTTFSPAFKSLICLAPARGPGASQPSLSAAVTASISWRIFENTAPSSQALELYVSVQDDYWVIIGWLLDDYWMIIGWLLIIMIYIYTIQCICMCIYI